MYSGMLKKTAVGVVDSGENVMALAFDNAHNSGTGDEKEFLDFTEEDWNKISRWEKHIRTEFSGMVKDMQFDLEQGHFDIPKDKKEIMKSFVIFPSEKCNDVYMSDGDLVS